MFLDSFAKALIRKGTILLYLSPVKHSYLARLCKILNLVKKTGLSDPRLA